MNILDDEKNCIKYNKSLIDEIGFHETIVFGYITYSEKMVFKSTLLKDMSFFNEKKINSILSKLCDLGKIKIGILPHERKDIISSKHVGKGIGDFECEWCKTNTVTLHEHHFPIQKKDGGKEVVKICPNCHYEYHAMESVITLV